MLRTLCIISLFWSIGGAWAKPADTHSRAANSQSLVQLYHGLPKDSKTSLVKRLAYFSKAFIGKPYLLFPLGEGPSGGFDQNPRLRLDGFDCETYVTTVIALSLACDPGQVRPLMDKMRYCSADISYLNRHHFTSLDWNHFNQKAGILKDITESIHNADKNSIAKIASANINRAAWIKKTAEQRLHLKKASPEHQQAAADNLIRSSAHFPVESAQIAYIPLGQLFDKNKKPQAAIWQQIPDGAVIQIVRPNWALQKTIGTNFNVSHLGFAFRYNDTIWFRHASTIAKKVQDEPLVDYLRAALDSPTIEGINIQVVNEEAGCKP